MFSKRLQIIVREIPDPKVVAKNFTRSDHPREIFAYRRQKFVQEKEKKLLASSGATSETSIEINN
jgi:hypothetical protein